MAMETAPQHRAPKDAALRRTAKPVLVYAVDQVPPCDAVLYDRARSDLTKVAEHIVPPRDARAFSVPAGHFFRIVSIDGPQVGDLN